MKKILILTAALLLAASSAFAGASVTMAFTSTGLSLYGDASSASSTTALIGKTSTGVGVGCLVDAANGAGYALVTQHKNGTKAFGSSYDSTAIYTTKSDSTPGSIVLAVPTATDTSNFGTTTWKTM